MKALIIAACLAGITAKAEEQKVYKGKSGSTYTKVVRPDGKPNEEMTLKGSLVKAFDSLKEDDSEITKGLSKYGLQIDVSGYLWLAHVSKSEWKRYRGDRLPKYVEIPCVAVAKESDPRGFEVLHCASGKQSSWWPF